MFIPTLIRAWRMRRAFRDTFNALSRLDDRALSDINVRRGEIYKAARKAAHKVAV